MVSSCTTTTINRSTLPQALTVQFNRCIPREGTAELALKAGHKLIATDVTLDFVTKAPSAGRHSLQAELTNPLGQTLMTLSKTPTSPVINVEGQRVPGSLKRRVATDDRGYLTIDGTATGMKLSELICGFGGVWPEAWLAKLSAFDLVRDGKSQKKSARLVVNDDDREIKLTLPLNGQMPKRCAAITLRYALGLHKERLAFCLHPSKGLGSLTHAERGHELRWVIVTD